MTYKKIVIGDATLYLGDCMEVLPTLERIDIWHNAHIKTIALLDKT